MSLVNIYNSCYHNFLIAFCFCTLLDGFVFEKFKDFILILKMNFKKMFGILINKDT
ncbi:uncharacterized protein B0P05DRAFT_560056 [Gilbertella persicaria]|uniref:uncharacterized protein n=1 Tax=Gilbertella persicaria TaxID=101096 RepID=UPI002220E2C9|nr:uncharacterized protein B0P05DRAFT_560056 [Gilbertella persicaria]KAI8056533.1 hypothetical protein B0P05DRAFT_560056 [Gilbertella persicaria]